MFYPLDLKGRLFGGLIKAKVNDVMAGIENADWIRDNVPAMTAAMRIELAFEKVRLLKLLGIPVVVTCDQWSAYSTRFSKELYTDSYKTWRVQVHWKRLDGSIAVQVCSPA